MLVYTILQMYTCRKHFPESHALSSAMVYILQVTRFLSLSLLCSETLGFVCYKAGI